MGITQVSRKIRNGLTIPPWLQFLIGIAVVSLAVLYIASTMSDRWKALGTSTLAMPPSHWVILCSGVLGTLVASALYHAVLLHGIEDHSAPVTRVAYAYALGQLARYVPGKVVGVAFQVAMLGKAVRTGSVLLALVTQTVYEYAWTLASCGALAWMLVSGHRWPLPALAAFAFAIYLLHRYKPIERVASRIPPLSGYLNLPSTASAERALLPTILLLGTWIPMLGGMALAFEPFFDLQKSILAGSLYALAAVASLLIVVVPSGLVVREAMFLWLGSHVGLPVDVLAFIGIATRIAMTAAELLSALLFSTLDTSPSRRQRGLQ